MHPGVATGPAVVLLVAEDALGATGADEHVAVDSGWQRSGLVPQAGHSTTGEEPR